MQEKLIIYLHAQDLTHPSWVSCDAAAHIQQSVRHGDPDLLASFSKEKRIMVVVPAQDVALFSVALPKMRWSRLQQALPFTLEEQLIEEVETLHFAVGDYQADGRLPVAVVSRKKMDAWREALHAWGIHAHAWVPATLALPFYQEQVAQNQWQVAIEEDISMVRTGMFSGFACDKKNLAAFLLLAMVKEEQKPREILIQNYTNQSVLSNLPGEVRENFPGEAYWQEALIRGAMETPSINLLQGGYAAKKHSFPYEKKLRRIAAYGGVIFIVLLFLNPMVSYWILKNQSNKVDAEIDRIYKNNFPQATRMAAPKLRMEEKLQKLAGQTGDSYLLRLLAYLGQGIAKSSGIQLQRFDFQGNQLTLDLLAASSEDVTALTALLMQQGLSVKQQNAIFVGNKIKTTLSIE